MEDNSAKPQGESEERKQKSSEIGYKDWQGVRGGKRKFHSGYSSDSSDGDDDDQNEDELQGGFYSNWKTHPLGTSQSSNGSNSGQTMKDDAHWSDEFHSLLIALSNSDKLTDEEEERHFENLRRLELDFVYTAETWGRVIIEELFLPDEKKTIKSLPGRGVLGGYKFFVRGIFYKFAHEIEDVVSSLNAAKVSAHELRACGAVTLYALESSDCSLLPPLMALVDFRGYRLLAVSQLPIRDDETLVYGSHNAGQTVTNKDARFQAAIEKMGRHFNLARHFSGADNATELFTGADIEGHYDPVRNRYYLIDLARMFPPEAPSESTLEEEAAFVRTPQCAKDCQCWRWRGEAGSRMSPAFTSSGSTGMKDRRNSHAQVESSSQLRDVDDSVIDNPQLYKQLRPYFVQQRDAPALSSDAFSKFQSDKDATECNRLVQEQTQKLRTVMVQRACVYLQHRETDSALFPVNFQFSHFLHERGMNVRLLGLVYSRLPSDCSWTLVCLMEMVARSFKSLLRGRFRAIARRKGTAMGASQTLFRASDEDFHDEAVRLLSMLVMHIEPLSVSRSFTKEQEYERWRVESLRFWEKLVRLMKSKFGLVAMEKLGASGERRKKFDVLCPLKLPDLLKESMPRLFERTCQCVGFRMASSRVFSTPVTPDFPLPVDSLLGLQPQVKHLNLMRLAEAKVLHKRALRERNQRACEMLRKAKHQLEQVLKESPPTRSFFLLATLGEILYALAIRIQPERIEFELADEALRNLMKAEGAFREIAARSMVSNLQSNGPTAMAALQEMMDEEAEEEQAAAEQAAYSAMDFIPRVSSPLKPMKKKSSSTAQKGGKRKSNGKQPPTINNNNNSDVDPAFLSRASSHPLVLKTQQAKRYANVISSLVMKDVLQYRCLVTLGEDLVLIGGGSDVRLWSAKRKQVITTIERVAVTSACAMAALPTIGNGFLFSSSTTDPVKKQAQLSFLSIATRQVTPVPLPSAVTSSGLKALATFKDRALGDDQAFKWLMATLDASSTQILLFEVVPTMPGTLLAKAAKTSVATSSLPGMTTGFSLRVGANMDLGLDEKSGCVEEVEYCIGSESQELVAVACRTSTGEVREYSKDFRLTRTVEARSGCMSTCVALSDETATRLAVGYEDSTICVLQKDRTTTLAGHLEGVLSVKFAGQSWPNQDTLFSSSTDRTIRIWNVALGVCIRVLSGHLDSVHALAYLECPKMLLSAAHDATVRTWRFDHVPFLPIASPDAVQPPPKPFIERPASPIRSEQEFEQGKEKKKRGGWRRALLRKDLFERLVEVGLH